MAPYVIVSFTFVRLRLLIPGQSLYGCPPHLDCLQHIILGCPAGRMLFGLCLDLTAYATPYPLLNWTSSFCVFHPKYTWYFIPPLSPHIWHLPSPTPQLPISPLALTYLFGFLTCNCLFCSISSVNLAPHPTPQSLRSLRMELFRREEPPAIFNPSCRRLIYLPSLITSPPTFESAFSLQSGFCPFGFWFCLRQITVILIFSKCWSLSLNFVYTNGNESPQRKHFLASSAPSYFQVAFTPSSHLGSVPQRELSWSLIQSSSHWHLKLQELLLKW